MNKLKNKKRLGYFFLNELNTNASTNQSLNTVNGLSKHFQIDFYYPRATANRFNNILSFFSINPSFRYHQLLFPLFRNNLLIEKITRGFLSMHVLFIIYRQKYNYVFLREISFLYFLSYLPKRLRPNSQLIFEAHKIYKYVSPKVSANLERKALSIADAYIAISQGVQDDLINEYHIPLKRLVTIPNGVNINNYKTNPTPNILQKKYHITSSQFVLVYAGSFKSWKGIDTLIESMKYIKTPAVKLLLIGAQDQYSSPILKLINKLSLNQKIIIDKYLPQKELVSILKESHIGIIPSPQSSVESQKYTSPIKLFEYLASGLPIICSDIPSLRRLVKEPQNCLFFTPGDSQSLAQKVDYLLSQPQLRSKMKKNNLHSARQYDWNNRGKQIHNFLTHLTTI